MRARALGALFLALALPLSGCAVRTKAEARAADRKVGEVIACGSYDRLARHWDQNARKLMLDLTGGTFMTMIPEEKRAEITIGSGPYHALMDLQDIGNERTRVSSYSVPQVAQVLKEWEGVITSAGKCQKDAA